VFDRTHDLKAVVDYIIEETRVGLDEPVRPKANVT
jgi:hypothetical protein